jgi:KaiC/GvpD/RAD55 family RecA-like ATPase
VKNVPIDDISVKEYEGNNDNELKILSFFMSNIKEVYSVTSDYFLFPENKDIYLGIKLLKEKNLEFDVQTLLTVIVSDINSATQVTYDKINKIYNGFNEYRNMNFCIQMLKDDYVKSVTTKKLFREVVNIVSNRTILNIDKLLTTSQTIVNTLTNIKENSDDVLMTSDVFSKKYLETIEKRLQGEQNRSLGHVSLDEVVLRPAASGEITYVAGESGSGKSVFVQEIERKLVRKKICVLKFSIEMDFESSFDRYLSLNEHYNIKDLQLKVPPTPRFLDRLKKSAEELESLKYYIFSRSPDVRLDKLDSLIIMAKQKFRDLGVLPKDEYMLVVIDLINMLKGWGESPQEIETCNNELLRIAKRNQVHILGVLQTNENSLRSGKQVFKKPEELDFYKLTLKDIKNASAYKERARVVLILNRPLLMKKRFFPDMNEIWSSELDIINCSVAKQNEGDIPMLRFVFDYQQSYKITPLMEDIR